MVVDQEPETELISVVLEGSQERFAPWERALAAVIAGVVVFGVSAGNLWVSSLACVGLVALVFVLATLPSRRRRQASPRGDRRSGLLVGAVWAGVIAVSLVVLFVVPERYTLTGGVLAAFLAAGAVWGVFAYLDSSAAKCRRLVQP